MDSKWQPDVIVGIDFGMTCTAVAYTMGPEWPEPKNIQTWPGKSLHELYNKVDTAISYDVRQTARMMAWGFLCDPEDEIQEMNQYFKLNLDPQYHGVEGDPPHATAVRWFSDYMHCIREHTMRYLGDRIVRFEHKNIDFVFSVPTTWKDPSMIKEIDRYIAAAGYGQRPNERATVSLTEAEAAAVCVLRQGLSPGETYIVCDAGGGTTDVNVLKVVSTGVGMMDLRPLSWTEGKAVGSTLIDHKIRMIVEQRLELARDYLDGDIEAIVDKMMRDSFMSYKCSFGADETSVPKFPLPIPGLRPGCDVPEANVENSSVIILRSELQAIFDSQIEAMYGLIDGQLKIVQDLHPNESISYLVLSGGLGSSPYVRRKLKTRYEMGMSDAPGNAHNMKIYLADQPQLAVVHGLVVSQAQSVRTGMDVYSEKCCPISFGVLCREEYDEKQHQGEDVVLDPLDNKRWAENQIQWLVKRGEAVSASRPVQRGYRKKIHMGQESDPWRAKIVMSTEPINQLPKSLKRGTARQICEIETVLDPSTMKRKNRHFWNFSREYNLAEFQMRMLIGTSLRFEILSKNGKCSKDHEEIAVAWQPVVPQNGRDETAPSMYPHDSPRLGRYA